MGGGVDFKVDLGRLQSMQTASFNRFYSTNDLSSVHSVGNQVNYTYVSNINSSIHYYFDIYNSGSNLCMQSCGSIVTFVGHHGRTLNL